MPDASGDPVASGRSSRSHRGRAISVASTIGLVGVTALLTFTTRSTPMPAATDTRIVADSPLSRPFPAPVTTATYPLPASIDATGRSDVSSALIQFIASVPDRSIISFPAGGVFGITKAISLASAGRHNLVFDGHGATIMYIGNAGQTEDYSIWYDKGGGANLTFENFILMGSSPNPGVYAPDQEGQHGVLVQSNYVEVANCTISSVWGDGLFVEGSDNVWLHNNHVLSAGRNGLSVISGSDVTAEFNAFDKVGYTSFDDEPNFQHAIVHRHHVPQQHGRHVGELLRLCRREPHRRSDPRRHRERKRRHRCISCLDRRQWWGIDHVEYRLHEQPLECHGAGPGAPVRPRRWPHRHGECPATESGDLASITDSSRVTYGP